MYSDPRDPWLVISDLFQNLCLVLCCDIYRNTLISIMYSACMIKYMIVNRGRYKLVSEPTACRKPLTTTWSMLSLDFEKLFC